MVKRIARGYSVLENTFSRTGVAPFIVVGIIALVLFIVFPQMVLFLPSMMR